MLSRLVVDAVDPGSLIWVVDDSATQGLFTERALGPAFRYERFADGASVIERLSTVPQLPDIVLLDWVMPGMSGDEVCRHLRQDPRTRELPIIILTASRTETTDVVCALESGANDYVAKPFVPEELRARVGSILRRSFLEKKERAMTRFLEEMVAIVAHDLRTPLSALHLGLGLLREEASERAGSVLGRLDRSTRRMTRIVDQLLDVTRARIGEGIRLAQRTTQLRAVVGGVLDELRGVHPTLELVLSGADAEGLWDHDRLEQVVSNLVNNAIIYGRAQGRVEVSVTCDDRTATLVVHNELKDAPIEAAILSSLFDPFERGLDRTNAKGLGLGLYIVSEIVKAHGGTIAAESDDTGTRFRVALPRKYSITVASTP